jgi:hypothetical protein
MTHKVYFYSINIMRVCRKEKILMKCGNQLKETYAKGVMAARMNKDMKCFLNIFCHLMHEMVDVIGIEHLLGIDCKHIFLMRMNWVA